MDQDGLFLMLKMCNGCSHNKGSWKKCMTRKHNPRMSTVRNEELTYGHRQCVKPDQSITIYKLRDNETNEEFLEFDENIVFQTACDDCLNIKTCLNSGHRLVDWRPTFAGGRAAGDPVGSPEADERDGETSACDSKETSSDSGSAVATAPVVGAAVAEGGGVCGKGKTKARGARAVEEEQAGKKTTNKRKSTEPKSTPPSKSKKTSASRPAASPKNAPQPSIKTRKPKPKARGVKRSTSPSAAARVDTGDGSSDELERPSMIEIDTSMSAADVDERERTTSNKRRGRKGKVVIPAVVTPSPKTDSPEAFGAAAAPTTKSDDTIGGGGGGRRNIGDRVRSSPRKSPASRRGSAGGTSTLSDVVPRKASDPPGVAKPPPPKTVAEKLELVKAEEAKLLRQFKETHKRYAQEEAEKRAEMEEFWRAGEEALRTMQAAKKEALRLIAEERNKKGSARRALIQERLKELEAAEEAARVEARERDARLQAERERLARNYKTVSLLSDTATSDTAPAPDPFSATEGEPAEPDWIMNAGGCGASAQPTVSAGSPESSADPAEQTRSGGDVVGRPPARRNGSSVKYVASQSAGGVKHPYETVFERELAAETAGVGRADETTGKGSASGGSRLASDAVKVAGSAPAAPSPVRRGRNHTRGSAPGLDDLGCCADRKPAQAFFSRGGAARRVGGGEDETAGVELVPLGVCTATPSAAKGSAGDTCLDRFRKGSSAETLVGASGVPANPEMNINGKNKQGNGGGLNGVMPAADLEGKTSCAVTAR